MTKYISKPENLKLMMNLLRDKSPNIQFEAFHVFKVKSTSSGNNVIGNFFPVPNGKLPALYCLSYLKENEIGSLCVLHDLNEISELC